MDRHVLSLWFLLGLGAGIYACPDGCSCMVNIARCPDADESSLKKIVTSLPKNITELVIGGPNGKANIKSLTRSSFKGITAPLESLTLDSTQLESVSNSAFRPLTNLMTLILTRNPLQTLPHDMLAYSSLEHLAVTYSPNFRKLESLDSSNIKHLDLSHNAIEFEEMVFSQLTKLTNLNISYNGLTQLQAGLFNNLPLDTLDISQAKPIENIPDKPFETVHTLTKLGVAGIFNGAVDKNFFSGLLDLRSLDLSNNGLREVPFDEILPDDLLTELKFDDNKLSSLKSTAFQYKNLQFLSLERNEIAEIKPRAFDNNKALQKMSLRENKLTNLPDDLFVPLKQLQTLDLSHNGLHVANRTLNGLTGVSSLNLSGNVLPALTRVPLSTLSNVAILDMSECFSKSVDADTFDSMQKLKILNLNNNDLREIPNAVLQRFKDHGVDVKMANNAWACDCDSIGQTKDWMEKNNFTESMICSTPAVMKGKDVRDLSKGDFCYAPNVTDCCQVTLKPFYGEDVSLECNATGSPEPNITYSKMSGEALPQGRYNHSDDWRSVTLLNITYSDIGNYTCFVTNTYGNVTKNYEMFVLTPEPTLEPAKPYKKGTLTWILLGVAIGVVLLVTIIGISVYFCKKRDANPNDLLVNNMENSIQ